MAAPGAQGVKLAQSTIAAARALGGSPRITFDVSNGKVSGITSEVVLTGEQAEVVAGRLETLRDLEQAKRTDHESARRDPEVRG